MLNYDASPSLRVVDQRGNSVLEVRNLKLLELELLIKYALNGIVLHRILLVVSELSIGTDRLHKLTVVPNMVQNGGVVLIEELTQCFVRSGDALNEVVPEVAARVCNIWPAGNRLQLFSVDVVDGAHYFHCTLGYVFVELHDALNLTNGVCLFHFRSGQSVVR